EFPQRSIQIIAGTSGVTATLARLVGQHLTTDFGYPATVVDPRAGAGGSIAAQAVAAAAPDGHTLLLTGSSFTIVPLVNDAQFDPVGDFEPVIMLASNPHVFVANRDLPVTTLEDFIAYVKERPGQLNYGSTTRANLAYFEFELMK